MVQNDDKKGAPLPVINEADSGGRSRHGGRTAGPAHCVPGLPTGFSCLCHVLGSIDRCFSPLLRRPMRRTHQPEPVLSHPPTPTLLREPTHLTLLPFSRARHFFLDSLPLPPQSRSLTTHTSIPRPPPYGLPHVCPLLLAQTPWPCCSRTGSPSFLFLGRSLSLD